MSGVAGVRSHEIGFINERVIRALVASKAVENAGLVKGACAATATRRQVRRMEDRRRVPSMAYVNY